MKISDQRDAISSEEENISGVSQGEAGSDKSGASNPDCRVKEGTGQASGSVSEIPQGEVRIRNGSGISKRNKH